MAGGGDADEGQGRPQVLRHNAKRRRALPKRTRPSSRYATPPQNGSSDAASSLASGASPARIRCSSARSAQAGEASARTANARSHDHSMRAARRYQRSMVLP